MDQRKNPYSPGVDRLRNACYNWAMGESVLRRLKKRAQNARWKRMKPAERLRRAAEITAAGRALRSAGLTSLGLSRAEISKIEHSRGR